jgi:hypothetical protein
MATAEELVYNLDFKWDKKSFEGFSKSIGTIVSGFAKFSAVVSAAEGVAFGIAKSVANVNDELTKNSKRLNIATEDYQKFAFATELGGAGADDLNRSLESLTKAQEDVLRGKGDLEAFGQLGLNPAEFQNSSDLLLAISDSISTIQSDTEKINLLERIGIPRDMLQTLEGGSDAIREAGKEFESLGGIVTGEQKKIAEQFNDNITRLNTAFNGIKNQIGSALIEPFDEFITGFTKFAKENMKEIIAGFQRFFEVVLKVSKVVFGIMERVFKLVMNIVDLFGGFENAVKIVGAAFLILQRRMLLTFAIPLAIATALFLIIEDIVLGLKGQDSVTKDIMESTGLLADIFTAIVKTLGLAAEGWSMFFNDGDKALTGLKILVNDLIDTINLIPFVELEKLETGIGKAKPQMGGLSQKEFDIMSKVGRGELSPEQARTMINNTQTVTVNVNGAQDPQAVVKAMNQEMQKKNNALFGGVK